MSTSKASPLPQGETKAELGITDNKTIPIVRVRGIDIQRFRSLENQKIVLGSKLTVLSGRNGTMKTSLMALIAHPFSSSAEDGLGKRLKTTLSEVFNLSKTYDLEDYEYAIISEMTDGRYIRSPVQIYFTADKTNRHRIVVSGSEQGDGNLSYNTSFLNLKRLYPIVDLAAQRKATPIPLLSAGEKEQLKKFYEQVFPSSSYGSFVGVYRPKIKSTWAPSGGDLGYDWESISSGEDNLGSIFNRLIGFQRDFEVGQKTGGGILCIDEFEATLHPVAQLRLFDYLLRWAGDFKTQVIVTTHSLGLISDIYLKHSELLERGQIAVNFVSKSKAVGSNYPILHNPSYDLAYKELTFTSPIELAKIRKLKIFCEDETAIHFLKRIIRKREILDTLEFHQSLDINSSKPGIAYTEVKPLADACSRFPVLFEHSLVVLDADVSDKFMSNLKIQDFCLRLPDTDGLALERRMIYYIMTRPNNDLFFEKFKKERDAFLGDFSSMGISLSEADVLNEVTTKISACKAWSKSCSGEFNKYVTHYVTHNLDKDQFTVSLMDTLNLINARIGLPPIHLQG
ncbi:AAA family ATPase [Pseudomonas sp. NFACC10-1]|uniref:AAA family ATPase n=1 Tax=Pseudomonas sp. NFACC10-1 TaxID=1566247 RepID=UPI000A66B686|nr:AAA family ATPase [Pseudomonas sp. NFACC10-1]